MAVLANLIARDTRSVTGSNVQLVMQKSGCNVRTDSPDKVRTSLMENGTVAVEDSDKWRVKYLGTLLEHRQEWQYLGSEEEVEEIQKLVDSLCVN